MSTCTFDTNYFFLFSLEICLILLGDWRPLHPAKDWPIFLSSLPWSTQARFVPLNISVIFNKLSTFKTFHFHIECTCTFIVRVICISDTVCKDHMKKVHHLILHVGKADLHVFT